MQLSDGLPDLTYCTNIHPADGWDSVFASLKNYAPQLKARLSPAAPFGLGLRLSASEAEELLTGSRLREFRSWLDDEGLYVALINGYPYGAFHGQTVKQSVFAPDWRDLRRLHYTLQLVRILRELLPAGMDGGVSTVPLSCKEWVSTEDRQAMKEIASNLMNVAEAVAQIRNETGALIHIDIEPEPGGLIENAKETISFFRNHLFVSEAASVIAAEHLRICYDACHFAVEYEDPEESMPALTAAGLRLGRIQVSSALKIEMPPSPEARKGIATALAPFASTPYLHQVIERTSGGQLRFYQDLPDALDHVGDLEAAEWRIHFHVPIFTGDFGVFHSTQGLLARTLALADSGNTTHLEIETYTWSVLPEAFRQNLLDSIEREFRWVQNAYAKNSRH